MTTSSDLTPIRRALISVSDKTGLETSCQRACAPRRRTGLDRRHRQGAARGGAHDVIEVADLTGFPEMMDGRVKTLHPAVHGGLLALRDKADHVAAMDDTGSSRSIC